MPTDNRPTLREIAERFPCLRGKLPKEGTPSDVSHLGDDYVVARWVFDTIEDPPGWVTGAGRHALNFLANVWNRDGRFNIAQALDVWDSVHRGAFIAWAQNPRTF